MLARSLRAERYSERSLCNVGRNRTALPLGAMLGQEYHTRLMLVSIFYLEDKTLFKEVFLIELAVEQIF